MKTILVYQAEHNGVQHIQQAMIENLRHQNIRFEKNQTESIIVGNTKILFYYGGSSYGSYRNDRVFVRKHKQIDAVFLKNDFNRNISDDNLVFKTFLEGKDVKVLSRIPDKAYQELAEEIDEVEKEMMFLCNVENVEVLTINVPVGLHLRFVYPLSERDNLIQLLENLLESKKEETKELQKKVEFELEKEKEISGNIDVLKAMS